MKNYLRPEIEMIYFSDAEVLDVSKVFGEEDEWDLPETGADPMF